MRLIVIATLMLSSTVAWAAPVTADNDADAAARRNAGPEKGKSKGKVALYDFENDNVSGDALSPDHEGVKTRPPAKWDSMIKVRMHFIPQLLQMAQDV